MKTSSKQGLKKVLLGKKLPSHDDILQLADSVSTLLENEVSWYRQADSEGAAGALLDFQSDDLPTIVVPDLHGRTGFLFDIINYNLSGEFLYGGADRQAGFLVNGNRNGRKLSVFKALEKGLVRLVFVGDILHTERNSKLRWLLAQEDFLKGNFTGEAMSEEMAESLSLWYGVFFLKLSFPEFCHVLKGNHENILNASVNGDFGFRKYANEGAMVKAFMQEFYGDDVLYMIHCVEKSLPLAVVGKKYVVSHAEPCHGFSKEEIVNGRMYPYVVAGLTWTDNGEAEEGSVLSVIKNLSTADCVDDYVYIGGHRYVEGNYALRQNGLYVQIHNPGRENIALVYRGRKFNPDSDIVSVNNFLDKNK